MSSLLYGHVTKIRITSAHSNAESNVTQLLQEKRAMGRAAKREENAILQWLAAIASAYSLANYY